MNHEDHLLVKLRTLTFRKRSRIRADHDVFVEGALEVSGEPVEDTVLSDLERSCLVPFDIESKFVTKIHGTNRAPYLRFPVA
jgi:hypothetical protein